MKQTDYGMKPVSVAGGTIKVKDEVKIEFSIATRYKAMFSPAIRLQADPYKQGYRVMIHVSAADGGKPSSYPQTHRREMGKSFYDGCRRRAQQQP